MSRAGRIAAVENGRNLPAFDSLLEAERALFVFRNERIALLHRLAAGSDEFEPDYMPPSLKALERWYFDLLEHDSFAALGCARATFEECMAMYFLQTAVRSSGVEWTVDENEWAPGHYQIGVQRPLFRQYTMRISHLPLLKQNKQRQALYREYKARFDREGAP